MSTAVPKPSLTGVRIRARKGAVKAQAKHEPTIFRDQLLKHIAATPPGDWDALYERLVAAGGQGNLELLKYADEMFDVLIIGGLLQPGGDLLQDNAPVCPFALVLQTTDKDVKDGVEVLNKLIRRYKYLQKPLEESSLPKLLQYGHRWQPDQRDRLAQAIGLMLANGLATSAVLSTLIKEHLVKDDVSATLLTLTLKSYLREQPSIDQLAGALRKGGIKDLTPFFVAGKRNPTAMGEWFREKGVPQVADWWAKRQTVAARDELVATVKEVAGNEDEGAEAIVAAIKSWQTAHPGALAEPAEALVGAVWPALMASVDWASARPDQVEALALREIGKFAPALEPFCNSAKVQVGLINVVQVYCYEDTRLMKVFPGILKVLYNADCISDKAIIYWHQKGSKPQGKQHFLKATEALVKFLEEQESEDDEE